MQQLTETFNKSHPDIRVSPVCVAAGQGGFTCYFAPRTAGCDMPEMKTFTVGHPDDKVTLDQIVYARRWFSTYNSVNVRKPLEDGVQAVLSGTVTPQAAVAKAQQQADAYYGLMLSGLP